MNYAFFLINCHSYVQYEVTLMMTYNSEKDAHIKAQSVKYSRCYHDMLLMSFTQYSMNLENWKLELIVVQKCGRILDSFTSNVEQTIKSLTRTEHDNLELTVSWKFTYLVSWWD